MQQQLGGAAVGATLALLFAPEKGEDMRGKIARFLKEKGIDLKKDKMDELVDEISDELQKR
ncbi:MAG: YtxH domain-containing protein [Muribaculaceae bacterium]|nr:YtxH domain-containing protein [Muribaculaceae bacterium]